jgi:hypothetical protein
MNKTLEMMNLPKSRVFVVANGDDPPIGKDIPKATVVQYPDSEFNMAKWWNMGLEYASKKARKKPYEVFVFESSTFASIDTVIKLAMALREHDLAATSPDRWGTVPEGHVHIEDRLQPLTDMAYRMTGYAFMLKGELELRADPKFRNWYPDDDLEWQAREAGGVGMVGQVKVGHPKYGSPLSPMLQRFADEDREKFKAKWGHYPY